METDSLKLKSPVKLKPLPIWEEEHFANYGGEGRDYRQIWKQYNSVEDCVKIFEKMNDFKVGSVMVLGAATGDILKFFDATWGTRPHGCELSAWAHQQIPEPYCSKIKNQDMRDYVKEFPTRVDLIYANSFMYLNEEDVAGVLNECARIGRFLFVDLSYLECFEEVDPLRQVLKPHAWWRQQFRDAGFSPYKRFRKLWESTSF